MSKFGVCKYNFNLSSPRVRDLQVFDTYEDAYDYYIENCIAGADGYPDTTEWLVWIEGDEIVQFDRFTTFTKCKKVKIEDEYNWQDA